MRAMKPGLTNNPQQGIFQAVYTRQTLAQSSIDAIHCLKILRQ
jgi:hypothetical protein